MDSTALTTSFGAYVDWIGIGPVFYLLSGCFAGSGNHWAHPAISDGRLYVRHGDPLMAYDIRKNAKHPELTIDNWKSTIENW